MKISMLAAVLISMLSFMAIEGVARSEEARLLRYPDIEGNRIAFVYAGDIWTVDAKGGSARRLTAHPGAEVFPKFSPDGRWLAFTGNYGGDDQVYVMPVDGGEPRQLTYYPARANLTARWGHDNQVLGWTPDGKSILFRSLRDHYTAAQSKLYTVSIEGGLPVALALPYAGAATLSPDGKKILYSPLFRDFRTWKRYEGGWAQDLWIYDRSSHDAVNITHQKRTDRDPMWTNDGIYFVSDRDDHLNIYRYDETSKKSRQITHYNDADVRWASADAQGQIVYELGGELHVIDGKSGNDLVVPIQVLDDGLWRRPETIAVDKWIESFSISPNGKNALFVARGEVFTKSLDSKAVTRNLTRTSGAHERNAQWSMDGRTIAFISDASGEEEIWTVTTDGRSRPRQLTKGHKIRFYGVRWSPDGRQMAVHDKDGYLHTIDAKTGKMHKIGTLGLWYIGDYRWSPDGRYLAYTSVESNFFGAIHIWDSQTQTDHKVTDAQFNSYSPSWDPSGEYLYYLSDRSFAPQMGRFEWNYVLNRPVGVFALALQRNAKNPFSITFEASDSESTKGPVKIEFDGLNKRVIRVPIDPDNFNNLEVRSEKLYLQKSGPYYLGRDTDMTTELLSYDIARRDLEVVADDADNYSVSDDGAYILFQTSEGYYDLISPDGDQSSEITTQDLTMHRFPRQEWAEIFDEVWRRYRDFFYVANMNGYDWLALRNKYKPLLKFVGSRADLNYVIGEMIAELNVSHAYVSGGDLRRPANPETGVLGARVSLDLITNRYRFTKIFEGQNEEPRYRSPLTEVGIGVHEGDYLLAINGVELRGLINPFSLLGGVANGPVELLVNNKSSEVGARVVTIKALKSDENLIYLNWVLHNKRLVTEASEGRLGYLHIPDMSADGLREFIKWYYGQIRKEGLIVDVRGNDGGSVSQMILERITSPRYFTGFSRGQQYPTTFPWGDNGSHVFVGDMVALANEYTMSDGDAFSWSFKQSKRGLLIGKRTWGGTVGIGDTGTLIDGGIVYVPQYALADAEGRWVVEGKGVVPDIEVDNGPQSLIRGQDLQLERAIAELLSQVKANSPGLPDQAPDPIKTPQQRP